MLTERILKQKPMKVLTKGEITKSALIELKLRGANCWMQNNLAVPGRKFIGRKGVSDILGYVEKTNYYEIKGTLLVCEVKTINDSFSDDQKTFLTEVKQAGGIALYATQELNNVVIKPWEG
jgi:hypothetical protein